MRTLNQPILEMVAGARYGLITGQLPVSQIADFRIASYIGEGGKTVLFPSAQALALRPALDALDGGMEYRLPFDRTILQFTSPIPEEDFFENEGRQQVDEDVAEKSTWFWRQHGFDHVKLKAGSDSVVGLALSQSEIDDEVHCQVVVIFASTAINRISWVGDGDLNYKVEPASVEVRRNHKMAQALARGCIAYINCVNMHLVEHVPDKNVNRRRQNKNKRPLPSYYTVEIKPEYQKDGDVGHGSGSRHGHIYDVRGHFRRLASGAVIWVRAHMRGLSNEIYIPSTRRVA